MSTTQGEQEEKGLFATVELSLARQFREAERKGRRSIQREDGRDRMMERLYFFILSFFASFFFFFLLALSVVDVASISPTEALDSSGVDAPEFVVETADSLVGRFRFSTDEGAFG